MKVYQRIGLLAAMLCGIAALEAQAQLAGTEVGPGSFILNFDENGIGSMYDGFGWADHPGGFATDPNTGILQLEYTVNRWGVVANGDVRVYDDFIGGHISDVLRFTDLNGNMGGQTADRMFFYSDDILTGDPADTGIPAVLFPNDGGGILEVNGVFNWVPNGAGFNVYNGTSVPEPASFSLVILGGLVGLRRLLWRKQS